MGESGSGKSTRRPDDARPLEADRGRDHVRRRPRGRGQPTGTEIAFRRQVQPVFQDPYSSLDPLYTVYRAIEEPLRAHGYGTPRPAGPAWRSSPTQVALSTRLLQRLPAELSGGQRQRVAIARALALSPGARRLRRGGLGARRRGAGADPAAARRPAGGPGADLPVHQHDLAVVRQIADHVLVMQEGRVVEEGTRRLVFDQPQEPYTRMLLDAIPGEDLELDLAG